MHKEIKPWERGAGGIHLIGLAPMYLENRLQQEGKTTKKLASGGPTNDSNASSQISAEFVMIGFLDVLRAQKFR